MLAGTYNYWLVLASLGIAILASYTALDMAGRVMETRGRASRLWWISGSVAMGFGIWSMHFVGMLAFKLPMPMNYDPAITFLSLLIGIASSAFALWMVCRRVLNWPRLCYGAVLMGAGVCTMHYMGMAAMQIRPGIRYIPSLFALSVVIAVVASGTALWIAFRLRRRSSRVKLLRAGAAVVMGIAIAGMHYTGMAAARFPVGSMCTTSHTSLSSDSLALLIIVFSLCGLSIALITSFLDYRASVLASSLAHAHEELQFLALHDPLTKLPNRTLLEDRLDQEMKKSVRSQTPFSLFFLDLDGFKQVNDAFGHHVGDALLVEVAERIQSAVRASDTIARVGGDEFVLVAGIPDPGYAANFADKLIQLIRAPFAIAGHDCQVTVSIGIAVYDGDECGGQELLKKADAAMYHAKVLGRNNYCFFDVSMNEDAQEKLQLLHDLRVAVEHRELVLYYQPKFDARSGVMTGVEALIRWQHPARGLVLPADFIPLAEKIGLILSIGEWTLNEACRQISEWRSDGYSNWTIAVNLSAVQFNHPGLVDLVGRCLERYHIPPDCLILEITESTAMYNPEASMAVLRRLCQMGVRISIDDFGSGYSSLLYLKQLPAGELKIDRGFVRDLEEKGEDAAIISAIVALGRTLDLEIVAEGVETIAQQEFLTRLGCNSLQGFLLGRPMPADQLIAMIKAGGPVPDVQEVSRRAPKLVAHLPANALA
ncbi:MAG TPA: EAL domain-containing protein [Acidobacteriaceae bacterium]|nr:EAL domain-containing protein [Acidobacteriaceae bacterium]